MVPFAGWEMPVQYEGVIPEHRGGARGLRRLRRLPHGRDRGRGAARRELLESLLSNDLDRIGTGQAQYTLLTNERGGIVDDLIVYELEPLPVPADRQRGEPRRRLRVAARSARSRVRRPRRVRRVRAASPSRGRGRSSGSGLAEAPAFTFAEGEIDGIACMVNRTGYTGEKGSS